MTNEISAEMLLNLIVAEGTIDKALSEIDVEEITDLTIKIIARTIKNSNTVLMRQILEAIEFDKNAAEADHSTVNPS